MRRWTIGLLIASCVALCNAAPIGVPKSNRADGAVERFLPKVSNTLARHGVQMGAPICPARPACGGHSLRCAPCRRHGRGSSQARVSQGDCWFFAMSSAHPRRVCWQSPDRPAIRRLVAGRGYARRRTSRKTRQRHVDPDCWHDSNCHVLRNGLHSGIRSFGYSLAVFTRSSALSPKGFCIQAMKRKKAADKCGFIKSLDAICGLAAPLAAHATRLARGRWRVPVEMFDQPPMAMGLLHLEGQIEPAMGQKHHERQTQNNKQHVQHPFPPNIRCRTAPTRYRPFIGTALWQIESKCCHIAEEIPTDFQSNSTFWRGLSPIRNQWHQSFGVHRIGAVPETGRIRRPDRPRPARDLTVFRARAHPFRSRRRSSDRRIAASSGHGRCGCRHPGPRPPPDNPRRNSARDLGVRVRKASVKPRLRIRRNAARLSGRPSASSRQASGRAASSSCGMML